VEVLVTTDCFTAEVWTPGGLVTSDVLRFIHLSSRKVHLAGMTPPPHQAWTMRVARNVTMESWGVVSAGQYRIHDRDGQYGSALQQLTDAAGVKRVSPPPRSPNLNAYAERWVRSVKEECLSRVILCGEYALQHALTGYATYDHHEGILKARATSSSSLPSAKVRRTQAFFGVVNASEGSYNTLRARRHEFVNPTREGKDRCHEPS
jgi:hypothetical protein